MKQLAWCMIVRGVDEEAELLDRCLASLKGHVDKIFIDVNAPKGEKPSRRVLGVCKKYDARTTETVWEDNFVKARAENFARAEDYEFIGWCDADDTVDNPEKLKEVCSIVSPSVDGIYLKYDYAHDGYGNVTVSHYTARIIRNNGTFAWKSSFRDEDVTVHETLNEVRSVGKVINNEVKIIHRSNENRRDQSLVRNIKLLEGMYKRSEDNPDPRILFYLASHYMDSGEWDTAKTLFERYLGMSGWAEERAQAWVYLGDIYKLDDTQKARGCYMRAVAENPSDPNSCVELAELEMKDHLWGKAVEWLKIAVNKKVDQTAVVMRPMEATYRAYKLLAEAYVNMGPKEYENAQEWLTKALKMRPFDPELLRARDQLEVLVHTRNLNDWALRLVTELKKDKEYHKIPLLIENLPESMQDSPLIHSVRNYYTEPQKWPEKSVAIVCGSSALGAWGPWSLNEGIGGSEEAVIQLSEHLRTLGWKVTVYATPGENAGDYQHNEPFIHGPTQREDMTYVSWKHYWEFNGRDTFDVLIGWRDPTLFDKAFKARKRYLWLHDVIDKEELIPQRLDNLEKVIFVSQYHRDLFPVVPDHKAFVSGNGIDPQQFEVKGAESRPQRDPYKVVYMSAHERGQEILQRIWPDVVKAVPKAHLHCYYGWAGYDFVNKDNPERMLWKDRIIQQQKSLPNFTDHGKINHKQVAREFMSAGVWAYPTAFPEVYCITGAKAMMGGAWPVVSDFAAIPEIVPYGDKIKIEELDKDIHVGKWTEELLEEYKQMLIHRLNNPATTQDRFDMAAFAANERSWERTASGWNDEFQA